MKLADMFERYELKRRELIERDRSVLEDHGDGDPDGFGEEPDDFGDRDAPRAPGGDDEEFRGAPADPAIGFEDEPDGSTFSGEPVFGEIPEPSADPEDGLWHGNAGADVSFPDYEGPKHRSSEHPGEEPDERGFFPRPKKNRAKRSRR